MSPASSWLSPALDALGVSGSKRLTYLVRAGHRCHVTLVCNERMTVGVVRIWNGDTGRATHKRLRQFHATATANVARLVPRSVYCERIGRRLVTAETALPGRIWSDDLPVSAIEMLADWFRERLAHGSRRACADTETLQVFFRRLTRLAPDGDELKRLNSLRDRMTSAPTPIGIVHNDLHAGNLLEADRRITGIIDWEHANEGPLLLDWFSLVLHLYQRHTKVDRHTGVMPQLRADRGPDAAELLKITDRVVEASDTDQDLVETLWQLAAFRADGGLLPKRRD